MKDVPKRRNDFVFLFQFLIQDTPFAEMKTTWLHKIESKC